MARARFGGTLAGRFVLTAGLGGMGGAQPLAATMNDAAILGIDVDESRIDKRVETGYCDRKTRSLDEALAWIRDATSAKRALSVGLVGNAADVLPELVRRGITPDVLTDQTSAHDTLNGYVPQNLTLDAAAALRRSDAAEYVRRANASIVEHVRAMLAMGRGRRSTTGTTFAPSHLTAASHGVQHSGFVPEYVRPLFCEGKGPFRWVALSGDPKDIARTDELVLELFGTRIFAAGFRWRASAFTSGIAGADLLARSGERALRCRAERSSRAANCQADRHWPRPPRHRQLASPFRETEAMKTGATPSRTGDSQRF